MPYRHFTTEERYLIAHMHIAEFSLREIGRRIGRHHGSISREIRRHDQESDASEHTRWKVRGKVLCEE